jgi:hypothetical protein
MTEHMKRCNSPHPWYGRRVRCEEPRGHEGDHFHSFYMRAWPQATRPQEATR